MDAETKAVKSEIDQHCLQCVYHCWIDHFVGCEYILVTGQRRGCSAGLKCQRFIAGSSDLRRRMCPNINREYPHEEVLSMFRAKNRPQEEPKRPPKNVPISTKAWSQLLSVASRMEVAETLGRSIHAVTNYRRTLRLPRVMAAKILEVYGIDIEDHRPSGGE
jgi:hypothetical protein